MSAQFDDPWGGGGPPSGEPSPSEEDVPPLKDWPPPEIVARWEARKEAARRRRAFRRKALVWTLIGAVVAAGIVFVVTRRSGTSSETKVPGPALHPATVVWSVTVGGTSFTAVITNPRGLGPVAVAIPDQTLVDIPGGPGTVGEAGEDPALVLAAAQAVLNRRIDHYLLMSDLDLGALVNRIGPIEVQVDQPFESDGRTFGPGTERLMGGPTVAYLQAGTDLDRTSRWEEVLTGILSAPAGARRWGGAQGTTDSGAAVVSVLVKAKEAAVLELPTAPAEGGGLLADPSDVAEFVQQHLGPAGTPLIRVVVLSANARRDDAIAIAKKLAVLGFRVVAAQPNRTRLALTQIVASDESFSGKAAQVQAILGVGSVYVAPDPSGVADITIVVGKDFKSG